MIYLTAQHQPAPAAVELNGLLHPAAPLIKRQDTARLAELGLYPHVTADGDAPLGYTDWVLSDGTYYREPAGTPELRMAARMDALRLQAHEIRIAERMDRESSTYPHGGQRYDCDERSAIRWGLVVSMALAALGTDPSTVIVPSGWRDTDGVARLFTAAQIMAAQQSLLVWGALCDAASQSISADIDAAQTIAEVETIISAIPTDIRWP